jgi:N-acetylmuramoyl-L-alanine amidase
MDLFNYLLEASICMALYYTLYLLIFKRLTFFSINRFYLLLIVVISLIIPALHIKITEPLPVEHINQMVIPTHNGNFEKENFLKVAKQTTYYFNWLLIVYVIYGLVCMVLLIRLFYRIFKMVRQAKIDGIMIGNNCIVHDHSINNASFFHIIFLRSNNVNKLEIEQILAHEKAHGRLLHSVDNLFIEMVKAFFWFNPFIYFIANALREVHEYEIDQRLKMVFDPKEYASLLVKLLAQPTVNLTNQFSAYNLKVRISMMFKQHSPGYKKWCYAFILPVLIVTGYWFSIEKVYGKTSIKKNFVLVLDAGHGGSQAGALGTGAIGIGGYREKDLNLQVVNQIKLVAEERGIQTILTRTDDRYLDIHDRVNNKADAFISIHMNSSAPGAKQTNGMEIKVDKNSLYPFSEKLAVSVKTALQQLSGINAKHEIDINETSPGNTLYILNHNKAPAILVELGYITDERDLNYVLNTHNQHEIAEKMIDAVLIYGNEN